jgi:hypothetical protein
VPATENNISTGLLEGQQSKAKMTPKKEDFEIAIICALPLEANARTPGSFDVPTLDGAPGV